VRLFGRGNPSIFERALEELSRDRAIQGRDRLKLHAREVVLSAEEARAQAAIGAALAGAGLAPPSIAELAGQTSVSVEMADRVVALLLRNRRVVKIDTLVFHAEALQRLKAAVASMKTGESAAATIDVATFKERFGVTRKFAIPLLEYLDRERV